MHHTGIFITQNMYYIFHHYEIPGISPPTYANDRLSRTFRPLIHLSLSSLVVASSGHSTEHKHHPGNNLIITVNVFKCNKDVLELNILLCKLQQSEKDKQQLEF